MLKKLLSIFVLLCAVGAISLSVWYKINTSPVDPNNSTKKTFVVYAGDNGAVIAKRLLAANLIKNETAFYIQSYLLKLNKNLLAGTFRISPSLTSAQIIQLLTTGGSKDIWVRIPEGSRVEEVAKIVQTSLGYDPQDFKNAATEGKIFPDSYKVPDFFEINDFLSLVNNNYQQKIAKAKENTNSTLSDNDTIILASLLEREGKTLPDKKIIAGILLNRVNANMPLQVDATAQYARDSRPPAPDKYWKPATKDDLQINSPFNTYKQLGLPAGPICSPSLNSLLAAYNPTPSDYLYYIHAPDGTPYYARTLEEHNRNIEKYLR